MASTSTTGSNRKHEVMRAFDEIAPSESTSASKRLKMPAYDVFINHRGPDVKHNLAGVLYSILTGMALSVFLDSEELEYGDFLPRTIEAAMKGALLHIAIFSERYAESSWCLEELSFILTTGATIIPIFYHVDPADLRYWGKVKYAKAFEEHEQKGRYSSEKLQKWKKALHDASFHSGEIIKNNDDLMRLLKNIERRVLKGIGDVPLVVAKHPVGLKEIVQDFEMKTLRSAQDDQVLQIVGVCGMGGSGKTTLAKELYNKISPSMERSSFLFDVRDAATKCLLHEKQKTLLNNLGVANVTFDNIEEGRAILARAFRSVKVLIVLDDVDHADQLDALLPGKESFERGTLIIVTTRECEVLTSWGISSIYKMRALNPDQAKQLFCWHAFLQSFPLHGFEKFVEKFVEVCNGLPLSLKVFGGQLYAESRIEIWESLLHKISIISPSDIEYRLKISYDALNWEEKEMFLDIACFFIGEKYSLAIELCNSSTWSGLESLERLENKCLIELDKDNRIRMNGHLKTLGREIANQRTPYRFWSRLQIINAADKQTEETLQIRGVMAAITQFSACSAHHEFPSYSSPYQPPFEEWLKIMQNSSSGSSSRRSFSLGLKLLVVTGDYFSRKFAELSEELVWLRWFDFKDAKLPSWRSLKNLRILELYGATSLKELWEDGTHPPFKQLTELNITCSWGSGLQRFPSSISELKHLKKIALIGYLGDEFPIKRLPEEFCDLKKLEHLELRLCRVLSSLPSRFGELTMLRHLDLSSCVELRILPVSFKQLTHLEYLDLSGCRKLTFRLDFLEDISKLEKLNLSGCRRLQELPYGIVSQANLRQLNMRDTRLSNMASNMDRLRKLSTLQIGSPSLRSLPHSLGDLSSLNHLTIFDCPNLESLPESVGLLGHLEHLCIESSGVKCLPESFIQLARLQAFEISGCPIRELNFGKGSSSSSCLCSLKVLYIEDTQVSRISISDDCCPVLKTLKLLQNEVLVEIVTLPTSLEEIELWECERLEVISCIEELTNLKYRQISGCPELDDSI